VLREEHDATGSYQLTGVWFRSLGDQEQLLDPSIL